MVNRLKEAVLAEFSEATSGVGAVGGGEGDCYCLRPPLDYRQFYRTPLGVDPQNGRYADVSIDFCFNCWRNWLHYQFEIEGISHSGRWYRGILEGYDHALEITWEIGPEDAARLLEEMPW